jgi:hypothetical protein
MAYIDDVQRKLIKGGGYDLTSIEGRSAAAETNIAFGSAVVRGENDDGTNYGNSCSVADSANTNLPTDADDNLIFLGVSHRTHALATCPEALVAPYGDGDLAYSKPTEMVSIQTQGRIPVLLNEDVQPGDPVVFSNDGTANNFDTWGKTPANGQEVTTAKWFQGGVAGELAVLELNGV